jgi:hypothetical protein
MNSPQNQPLSVRFEYPDDAAFEQVSKAMQAFSNAFAFYSRSKTSRLTVRGFESGSLVCLLDAPESSISALEVMIGDFSDLAKGERSVLMQEGARENLKRILENVERVTLSVRSENICLDSSAIGLLERSKRTDSTHEVVHSGLLDKVDLKSNTFRIMLPHGQRVNCSPAIPFSAQFGDCLRGNDSRLRVSGSASYKSDEIVPTQIRAEKVDVVHRQKSFVQLLEEVKSSVDGDKLRLALQENYTSSVSQIEHYFMEG